MHTLAGAPPSERKTPEVALAAPDAARCRARLPLAQPPPLR